MDEINENKMVPLNENLRRQYLFSFLGEMMGAIAHDLNNPLMIILGKGDMISRGVESKKWDDSRVIDSAQKIVNTSKKMSLIIESCRSLNVSRGREEFREMGLQQMLDDLDTFFKKKLSYVSAELDKKVSGNSSSVYRVNYLKLGLSLIPWVNIIVDSLKGQMDPLKLNFSATQADGKIQLCLEAPFSIQDTDNYNDPSAHHDIYKDWGFNLMIAEDATKEWGADFEVNWDPFKVSYTWSDSL
jgi:signal transduction histidine kinase